MMAYPRPEPEISRLEIATMVDIAIHTMPDAYREMDDDDLAVMEGAFHQFWLDINQNWEGISDVHRWSFTGRSWL